MTPKIRVMIVEDSPEYRGVIEFALMGDASIVLESQFSTAEVALRNLQDITPGNEPDLILLDLNLPGMSGLDAIPWIKEYVPKTQIIVLTQSDAKADVLSAIEQGAAGYLLKSSTVDQVKTGIQVVMDGGSTLDDQVARFILNTLKGKLHNSQGAPVLSGKEINVLTLLAEGLQKKEISEKLRISVNTVDSHVRHIYEKLNVQNAPAAVHRAHKIGLFSLKK